MLTALGSKEAEMKIIGCDLHAAQQTIAMLDRETGEIVEKTLRHQAGAVREFYAGLPAPVVVGLEATGSMGWFLQLLDELGVTYRVGHPATIRKAEPRKQNHASRNTTDEMRRCCCSCWPTINFRRSGFPRRSCGICARCCCTGTSGCVCGHACRTPCTRSPWVT